jgi:hypothetical protein
VTSALKIRANTSAPHSGTVAGMAGDGFNVVTDALRTHAGSVDTVADQVATAKAAGAQVRMGHDAYGKLPTCQMIAALLDPIQGYGVDALGAAVDALQGSAGALRAAASGYDGTDTGVEGTFRATY